MVLLPAYPSTLFHLVHIGLKDSICGDIQVDVKGQKNTDDQVDFLVLPHRTTGRTPILQYLAETVLELYCWNWGYVFFTDDSLGSDGNPWDQTPSYFLSLLAAVANATAAASPELCGTRSPTPAPSAVPVLVRRFVFVPHPLPFFAPLFPFFFSPFLSAVRYSLFVLLSEWRSFRHSASAVLRGDLKIVSCLFSRGCGCLLCGSQRFLPPTCALFLTFASVCRSH